MSSKFSKVAAVAASAALVVSGAQVANAQAGAEANGRADLGSLNLGSTGRATADAPSGTPGDSGSLKAFGQSPDAGSLIKDADATGTGSIDTSGSALKEPTTGSLAGALQNATGSDFSNPAPGTGSLDTTSGSLKEPTTGSLAPLVGQVAGSLGTDTGITTIANSGSAGLLIPVVVLGGSIAAGVAAWPAIQNALGTMHLPPLPGMGQTPPPAQVPGNLPDNGRG